MEVSQTQSSTFELGASVTAEVSVDAVFASASVSVTGSINKSWTSEDSMSVMRQLSKGKSTTCEASCKGNGDNQIYLYQWVVTA